MSDLTVALDMDSTVYNLHDPWLAWIEQEFGESCAKDEIFSWGWDKQFKAGKAIYDFLHIEGMFYDLPLMPWAKAAIDAVSLFYNVRQVFVTNCITRTGPYEKQQAVKRDFPDLAKNVIVTSGLKGAIDADVLVDDGPHFLITFRRPGRVTVKVPYSYNRTVAGDYELTDWRQYPHIIDEVLACRGL